MSQPEYEVGPDGGRLPRRHFIKAVASGTVAGSAFLTSPPSLSGQNGLSGWQILDSFNRPNSWYHGDMWESLNPGFWKIENKRLRRRLRNFGDRARRTGFPYHYETHGQNGGVMSVDYDPSLPHGVLYRRDWKLSGDYEIAFDFTIHGTTKKQRPSDQDEWQMYQPGYGFMGIAFGAKNLFDSYGVSDGACLATWRDDGYLEVRGGRPDEGKRGLVRSEKPLRLKEGGQGTIQVSISSLGGDEVRCQLRGLIASGETISVEAVLNRSEVEGYMGVAARGLLDFDVARFRILPGGQAPLALELNECLVTYALGATLKEEEGQWRVRLVSLFRSDGDEAAIRISDTPQPTGGWEAVAVAGRAPIISNAFRRSTAVIEARLPGSPAERTYYYTVWKDGQNVTADSRIGTEACGAGTGFVGDVPGSGDYVGRLPKLSAPYRLCGLSCHAIHSGRAALPDAGRGGANFFRDQPTLHAYRTLEDYEFQVMLWEDDVWYLELMLYPPSTDDAYKVIANTIAGPASRWQMMRHWNVINPGDHDYGMDDVKGPEQLALRWRDGLGQDRDYMRRNFQIVQHLISGQESISPTANPKKWHRWKMPNRDFSLLVLDSRLWRSSQDTKIWDDEGWGHVNTLYDRADPTRSLLGEEQFAWLQEVIRTDSSRLICLTGLNGLHTVWTGRNFGKPPYFQFEQRDRVAADYAGWVKAGVDRVLSLLSGREGVVSVYGDVHNGSILKNLDHRIYECSFGPIGRSGGRRVIEGFGPLMKDYDGRPLEVVALYHQQHGNPQLEPRTGPYYWNFLEMVFDPSTNDSRFELRIRNMVDGPDAEERGGGSVKASASSTGRPVASSLPALQVLPDADVLIADLSGRPIRGAGSDSEGRIQIPGLVGVSPGSQVLVVSRKGIQARAQVVVTTPV